MKKIWSILKKGWMKFAFCLGWINTRILLSLFFYLIIGVYAIISKVGKLFTKKKDIESYWNEKEINSNQTLNDLTHQF